MGLQSRTGGWPGLSVTRQPRSVTEGTADVRSLERGARALSQVAFKLCAERDENALIHAALDDIIRELGVRGAAAVILDAAPEPRTLAQGQPFPVSPADARGLAHAANAARRAVDSPVGENWICAAPLVVRSGTVGALLVFDRLEPPNYDPGLFEALGRMLGAGIENARLSAEVEASAARADVLTRTTAALGASHDLKDIVPTFAGELRSFQPFDRLACAFLNDARDYLDVYSFPAGSGWGLGSVIPVVGTGPGSAVVDSRPVVATDLSRARRFREDALLLEQRIRSYLIVPLHVRTEGIGALCLASGKPAAFDAATASRLKPVAGAVALAFDNARLFLRIKDLSITDDLTPLYNLRYFQQVLDREMKFTHRHGKEVSILFLDLDRFKPINDTFGHLRGSRVLREIGVLVKGAVRETDYPARYGGDEFCVILPQTSESAAARLGEKLRTIIESHTFLKEEGINATIGVSIGVAAFPTSASDKESLIRIADERMYADKERRKIPG